MTWWLPTVLTVLLGAGAVTTAVGATVTVSVATESHVSAEDTLIIFDPLDETPPPAKNEAIIDQVNMRFVPRITVLRTGTSVTFPNSDNIRHQVYSFSKPKIFSLKLYANSPQTAVSFDAPGLVVLGCNIHDRMVAFVGVVDSPYFAKLPASGTATLLLPSGHYRLRVWHPGLQASVAPQLVLVAAAPLTIPVNIDINRESTAVALWPE